MIFRKIGLFLLYILGSLIVLHIATILFFLVYKSGEHSLFITRTNPEFELRRQMLLTNMSLLDKFVTVGYTSGFVDNIKNRTLFQDIGDESQIQSTEKNIKEMGICEFNGKEVSMYAYFELKTILGMPYKDYVITCNYVSTRSYFDSYGKKEVITTRKQTSN